MFTTWLIVLSFMATGMCYQCPPGWEYKFSSCYGYADDFATWGDAQATCRAYGAKLVEIETSEENVFVQNLVRSRGADHVWIGGNTIFRGGTFEWATTQKLLYPFTDMAPGEPNRDGKCLVMWKASGFRWGDNPCTSRHVFVCERDYHFTSVK